MSASSRTTFSVGTAVSSAASNARAELLESLADALSVPADDLVVEGAEVTIISTGETSKWSEHVGHRSFVGHGVFQAGGGLHALEESGTGPLSTHWHQGGLAVEVEVNVRTGKVRVTRAVATAYVGREISAVDVRRQMEGSVVFGLGPALYEELLREDGIILNPNLSEYQIPTISEIPEILDTIPLTAEHAEIHGVAEMNVPVVAPAIGNAIHAATGVRIRSLPMTAEDLYWLLDTRSG